MPARPSVLIIGAGPAGVAAAYRLADRGDVDVTVLEASDRVGGNAASIDVGGIRCDLGSHRLHPACAPAILADIERLLGDDLVWRRRHGRIRLAGTWLRFPLRPTDLLAKLPPRLSARFVRDLVRRPTDASRPASFADELEARFGPTLSEEFYFPYAEKIWGLTSRAISVVQAEKRIGAGSLRAVAARAVRTAVGPTPTFGYPRDGFGEIAESFAAAAASRGASIRLGSRVRHIETERGRPVGVRTDAGAGIEADLCLSTMPIPALAGTTEAGGAVLDAAGRLRFRAMLLVYVVLGLDRFSEWDAHYFPDPSVVLTRLSEPKWYRGGGDPTGRTVLCAEIPCDVGDESWRASDAALTARVCEDLRSCDLVVPDSIDDVHVKRVPTAYPVYPVGFEADFELLDTWVRGIDGLVTLGRQGLFVHDNSHHALEMGYVAAECVDAAGRFDSERWWRARQRFAENTVED